MRKICYAIVLCTLVFSGIFSVHIVSATTTKPVIEAWGTLTKSMDNPPVGMWNYTSNKDVASFLENYDTIDTSNLTVVPFDIGWKNKLTNITMSGQEKHGSSKYANPSIALLTDSYDMDYVIFNSANTSTVTDGLQEFSNVTLPSELNVDSTDYLYTAMRYYDSSTDFYNWYLEIGAEFLDAGGGDHWVIYRNIKSGGESVVVSDLDGDGFSDDIAYSFQTGSTSTDSPVMCRQIKMSTIETDLGVGMAKLNASHYGVWTHTQANTATSYVKFRVRTFQLFNDKVEIEGQLLNASQTLESIEFPSDASWDSEHQIDRVGGVAIPFTNYPSSTKIYEDTKLQVEYEFEVLLPEENELTYSAAKINYTVGDGTIDTLTINAKDYLSKVTSKDAGDEVTILTSLVAGELTEVETKITYTEDQYYALAMEIGITWYSPAGFFDKILAVFLAIANALGGFGATSIKRTRARIRTP